MSLNLSYVKKRPAFRGLDGLRYSSLVRGGADETRPRATMDPVEKRVAAITLWPKGALMKPHDHVKGPEMHDDGTMSIPSLTVPFSSLASAESRFTFVNGFNRFVQESIRKPAMSGKFDIAAATRDWAEHMQPHIRTMEARYPVEITPQVIGGVATEVFVPKGGISAENRSRILIHLHAGAFLWGAGVNSKIESIPIAALGKIKIVSVDYRMGPQHKFPAASEDLAAVYRELLKDHRPEDIGIYGSSAGGTLTAEAMAWFDNEGLPFPGAIGVLCAGLGPISIGDSHYTGMLLTGMPLTDVEGGFGITGAYFGGADPKDPLVYPENSPELLAKFPPTLFMTGTRSAEMSNVVKSHLLLTRAGIETEMYIWDGMWHCFLFYPDLRESKEAYDLIARFFNRRLGKR